MPDLELSHFARAADDIGRYGDNDTLPFDIDTRFIKENAATLAKMAFAYSQQLDGISAKDARKAIGSLRVFSERLLTPTGSAGFRITTKVHPFWAIYFNGLGIAIGSVLEPRRSERVHSYRLTASGEDLFDRASSWRAFREATIRECEGLGESGIIVQTDISSFYEHVSHHRVENLVHDLFPAGSTIATQVDRFLSRFASGRSFGLPVGGQCSRILAELLLSAVDRRLSDERVKWRRYVDDFVLFTSGQADAYRALSILAHSLADYGLTLNRTKTTLLTEKHYVDYVRTQLGIGDAEVGKLVEIDLHFDPYSETADSDYEELREVVEGLNVRALLNLQLHKAQPDTFLVAQIGRTLRLHEPRVSLELCETLLSRANLHAFRASWSTIMRGVAAVRGDDTFAAIFEGLDLLLDAIPEHSPHLLRAESSVLHYLRTIRYRRTERRAECVSAVYGGTASETVIRSCIDCWRLWKDRPAFTRERNRWESLSAEQQRMLWLAASQFGDEGQKFRQQTRGTLEVSWSLGIERPPTTTFATLYADWASA